MASELPARDNGVKSLVVVHSPGRREFQWLAADHALTRARVGDSVTYRDRFWVVNERIEEETSIVLTLGQGSADN